MWITELLPEVLRLWEGNKERREVVNSLLRVVAEVLVGPVTIPSMVSRLRCSSLNGPRDA